MWVEGKDVCVYILGPVGCARHVGRTFLLLIVLTHLAVCSRLLGKGFLLAIVMYRHPTGTFPDYTSSVRVKVGLGLGVVRVWVRALHICIVW